MPLLEDLTWRYATKKMSGARVPADKLAYILEAARLAPSSSGLQPYKILVISDPALLAKVREVAFNQSQITDCSHLLVFAAWDGYSEERISRVFNYTMDQRGLPYQTMAEYKQNLLAMYEPLGTEWQAHHAAKQSYIAFAMAITAAAEQRVDATPIEGFNADQLDTLLQLKGSGYRSTVLLPLGYRQEAEDWLVNMKKVRTPMEEFVSELTLADVATAKDQPQTSTPALANQSE
ncbi:nitroreductase family protein [Hymenobacter pini]|uniref:nitroreductase family protein n=1 Tax=Hymenobacter pini TaxID=2880879 RepID=UPI001CF2C3BF|nr:nitroreductase family protein [Hymenobacter pini]MCA8830824.1 nitroreductase family protein [Hymenobacter pini]